MQDNLPLETHSFIVLPVTHSARAAFCGAFLPGSVPHAIPDLNIIVHFALGNKNNKAKSPLFSAEERVRMLNEVTKDMPNVTVVPFEGLLVDFARKMDAGLVIRGLRAITDFEYELQMAQTNHKMEPDVETVFLTTSLDYSYLSSTTVKEVAAFGGDISQFVPGIVADLIEEKMNKRRV